MRKKRILILVLIFWTALAAQEDFTLKKIRFSGNTTLSNGKLKRQLSLKAKNIGHTLLFWKADPTFNEFYLEEDIKQLTVDYQKEGFLHVQIIAHKEINHSKKEIELTFEIEEKEPVLINEIEYEIISENADSLQTLLQANSEKWNVKSQSRFQDSQIKSTVQQLFRFLQEEGYPAPEIDFTIQLHQNDLQAKVIYSIITGEKCNFGKIEVTGNEKTPLHVIEKQFSIREGEQFSQREIERTQRFIQQLGMFQIVTIRNRLNSISENRIPIYIVVHELPYWSIKTGIGYGLEDRFRISFEVKKLGFLGGARQAVFYAKHSYLEPYHFSLKVTQPSFLNKQSTFLVNPFWKKEREKAYELERYGVNFTLQQNISIYTNIFSTYKFERNNLEEKQATETSPFFYNKSSISGGITRDSSSPAFFPEKGFHTSLITTLSGLKLGSKFHYWQVLADARTYQKIVAGTVLAFRGKFGIMKPIWGDETTPIEERFYAGGSTSVRGWTRGEIGPRNQEDYPIGGNSYLEFSIELRQRIYKIFYLVIFGDAGNVWANHNGHDFKDLQYASGAGIRIKTPIGPIRFDAAQPLWHSRKQIQLHISIGQAF